MKRWVNSLLGRSADAGPVKVIGLVPGRNEEARIAFCLRALSKFTDAIVYLDDCSDDATVETVEALAEECGVARIIQKDAWYRDEPGDRNALLEAGRALGGTHFVVIDADEALTANCLKGDLLKSRILALKPGEQLALHWIQLWRSVGHYRDDQSVWSNSFKRCIFCDDGKANYQSNFIHTSRIPKLKGKRVKLKGENVGLLHFQFVNWSNLELKQRWYRCLERVRDPEKSIAAINAKYADSVDETDLGLSASSTDWFEGYDFFDPTIFDLPDTWRLSQMEEWGQAHGADYFDGLD